MTGSLAVALSPSAAGTSSIIQSTDARNDN
jgi:hypothetical protein